MKKIITLLLLFCSSMTIAESVHANPEKNKRDAYYDLFHMEIDTSGRVDRYKTDEYLKEQFRKSIVDQEEWIATEYQLRRESRDYTYSRDPIVLELVFHILYTGSREEAEGDISFQVDALNRDFGPPMLREKDHHDPDGEYGRLAADPSIQFQLSSQVERGIANIRPSEERWQDYDGVKDKERGSSPVDPGSTINIWVTGPDACLGSYAQYPGGPVETDGIVIDQRYFGRGSTGHREGKTLTHLMGNWLGLFDLYSAPDHEGRFGWCQDDGVPDTPPHNAPNVGDPMPTRHSTCLGYPRAMVMNFMDDTNDKNMYMFTHGQVQRMRYFVEKGNRSAYVKK